jgi:TldD protein
MSSTRREFLSISSFALGIASLHPKRLYSDASKSIDKDQLADVSLISSKRLGASYADIRINRETSEAIFTREHQVEDVVQSESFGFGVRVLVKGAWGFAANRLVTEEAVRRTTEAAVAIARANAAYQEQPVTLVPVEKQVAKWKSSFQKNPFEVALDQKIQFLISLNERALKIKGVSFIDSSLVFVQEDRFFASSEGSRIEQTLVRCHPGFNITAVDTAKGNFVERESLGGPQAIGYEYIENYPWQQEAEEAAYEVVEKLNAKPVAPAKYDLVLHPTHLWLTIHESAGHSTELDRALGWEADCAGTSFLTPDKKGKFQFGSKRVNFIADRIQAQGLATVGYDDDGVKAQRWYLVEDGVFVDWQTTRELAARVGHKSSYGCCHAQNWDSVPFPRMPNVSLEPSKQNVSLEDLIADVKNGILIFGDGSFSIDQQRYNFQFGGQVFWEIKDGKKGVMLRDVAYQSRTPDFWGACDGLGGVATYELHGSLGDGKGEPMQSNPVSHGCPVARFRQINVLNTGT